MFIFKCKMCGGTIEFEPGATIGVCDSCGTKQTLPRLDDDRRANLYDRANHFRRNNDFDKAAGIYEQILNEDTTDAEAYWSLVLCQYGIEYVEDPATHKRIPTVNRTQFTSIFDDDNYKSALQYADGYQRSLYEEEATTINEIQKDILAISQKEEPFDIFICYKETDNNGRRTQDSVLANDLYHQLTQEGFKVFFSRITLEDKLGTAYEPYIFAALNSARVMVVLGTKPEHFNAVWVKNEWSRYLSLVKQGGGKKVLIPAYKDMDPYNLPEEFSHLQAQDMSKLGFMQDLIRGIEKFAKAPVVTPVATAQTALAETEPLLKRIELFLEDGEFDRADDFCEQVLNIDPTNADAYIYKLLVEYKCHSKDTLSSLEHSIGESKNFAKVIRFGTDEQKAYVQNAEKVIQDKIKERQCELMAAKVGDYVVFGSYVQEKESNVKEDIEWLVLAKEGDKVLVTSKYALDCLPYNTSLTDVTWETCSLRKWLNETFFSNAFSSYEKNMIQTTTIKADKYRIYSSSPGYNTTDKVFLLSKPEADRYFSSDEARRCVPTEYAIAQGAYTYDEYSVGGKATCWWWLRSPGGESNCAAVISVNGAYHTRGREFDDGGGGVRPALWINPENYGEAIRFGDEKLENEMHGYIDPINERNENARRQEEAQRIAIENKAEEMAMAINKNGTNQSLQQRLTQQRSLLCELQALSQSFEGRIAELQTYDAEISNIAYQIQQLQAERSGLGLFAMGRKFEIDEKITACFNIKNDKEQRRNELVASLMGYHSKGEVETVITQTESNISVLENRMANQPEMLSFGECILLYHDKDNDRLRSYFEENHSNLVYALNSITFGHYRQSANSSNEPEPIEWIILDVQNGNALLLSKYALDCQPYNISSQDFSWKNCSLRQWLNGMFISNAFSSDEQNMIQTTIVTADQYSSAVVMDQNTSYSLLSGSLSNTTDKVFLLSIPEANKYFSSDEARRCVPTDYTKAQGAWTSYSESVGGDATCGWWLRALGFYSGTAAGVFYDGSVNRFGADFFREVCCVRPALWINLES